MARQAKSQEPSTTNFTPTVNSIKSKADAAYTSADAADKSAVEAGASTATAMRDREEGDQCGDWDLYYA